MVEKIKLRLKRKKLARDEKKKGKKGEEK